MSARDRENKRGDASARVKKRHNRKVVKAREGSTPREKMTRARERETSREMMAMVERRRRKPARRGRYAPGTALVIKVREAEAEEEREADSGDEEGDGGVCELGDGLRSDVGARFARGRERAVAPGPPDRRRRREDRR